MGFLNSRDQINTGKFFRPVITLERVIIKPGNWRIGTRYYEDKNEVRDRATDTLRLTSFIQNKTSIYLKNDPAGNTYFYAAFNQERPKIPKQNQFELSERVTEWDVSGHLHQWENFKMEYTLKHRETDNLLSQPEVRTSNL